MTRTLALMYVRCRARGESFWEMCTTKFMDDPHPATAMRQWMCAVCWRAVLYCTSASGVAHADRARIRSANESPTMLKVIEASLARRCGLQWKCDFRSQINLTFGNIIQTGVPPNKPFHLAERYFERPIRSQRYCTGHEYPEFWAGFEYKSMLWRCKLFRCNSSAGKSPSEIRITFAVFGYVEFEFFVKHCWQFLFEFRAVSACFRNHVPPRTGTQLKHKSSSGISKLRFRWYVPAILHNRSRIREVKFFGLVKIIGLGKWAVLPSHKFFFPFGYHFQKTCGTAPKTLFFVVSAFQILHVVTCTI